jgi:hypothetical protein
MAKGKTNNDLQNITHEAKRSSGTNLIKIGGRGELRCSGMVGSSCSTSGIHIMLGILQFLNNVIYLN